MNYQAQLVGIEPPGTKKQRMVSIEMLSVVSQRKIASKIRIECVTSAEIKRSKHKINAQIPHIIPAVYKRNIKIWSNHKDW